LAVPVGKVPSTGNSDTGRLVALAGDQRQRDAVDEVIDARRGTGCLDGAHGVGQCHAMQAGHRLVDGLVVEFGDAPALAAVGLLDRMLDRGNGFASGRMPEMAKKQVCITVLMRRPMSASCATL
jgi:hypothetical protein